MADSYLMATPNDQQPPSTLTVNETQIGQKEDEQEAKEQEANEQDVKKRKRHSKVWEHFEVVMAADKKEYNKCKYCPKRYSRLESGTTTQMKRHIETCPGKAKAKGQKQLALLPAIQADGGDLEVVSLSSYKYDKELVRKILCILIIVDERPFRSVESKVFRYFCKALNPRCETFTRHTIRRDCMKLFDEEKAKLKRIFEGIDSVCFTSDTWTSNQNKSYLSFTAHFVDAEWKLQKRIINFRHFPPPHTGYALSDFITDLVLEWNLQDKFFTLTLDNASSNDNMAKLLHGCFPSNPKFTIRSNVFHVRCAAHILNLIVQVGLKHIKLIIDNVRESIKYIRGSTARIKQFETSLAHVGIVGKRGLNLDVSTRWNSTYLMLSEARKVKLAFDHFKEIDANYIWCPSEVDWKKYEEVEELLGVFYEATLTFSSTKHPTSNLFFMGIQKVKRVLKKFSSHEAVYIRNMVEVMSEKFDKYWAENSLVLAMGCILDPRYKLGAIKFVYSKLYPNEKDYEEHLKIVVNALECVFKFYENRLRDSSHIYFPSAQDDTRIMTEDEEFEEFMNAQNEVGEKKSDLDSYLTEERLRLAQGDKFDVLDYWKAASLKYKALGIMAKDILAIPISTVASESAFSTARRVISDYRSSLRPNTIEALICTQSWLRPHYLEEEGVDDEKEDD